MRHQASDRFWQSLRPQQALATAATIEPGTTRAGALVFIGYYLGAKIGLALTFQPHPMSVYWPPNSILLAALLLTPPRIWWFLLAAAFPAQMISELQYQVPPTMAVSWFISNCGEALIGAGLTRYLLRGSVRFDNLRGVATFCVCAGILGPFLSSFVDAGFVALNGWGQNSYLENWRDRFFSNCLTALTLTPAIVTWFDFKPAQWRGISNRRGLEVSVLFLGLVITSTVVLYNAHKNPDPVLFYAPLPFLLWAVFRFGARATSAAILIVTFLAIWSSAQGHGPFTGETAEINARSIQMFLIVMTVPIMLLAAGIQERRDKDAALRESEERMRLAADAVNLGIWEWDLNRNEIWSTDERRSLLGWPASGRGTFEDFISGVHSEDRNRVRQTIDDAMEGRKDYDCEYRVVLPDGIVRWMAARGSVHFNANGKPVRVLGITIDITARKQAELDAKQRHDDLSHLSRVALMGELSASIAHEINQPLGAILSNADAAELLLESENPPLDEIRKILADIRNDNLRASEIIRHLRLLARKRRMQIQLLDLNEVVSEVAKLMEIEAMRRSVVLRTEFTAGQATILGDRVHLQQVLINLILNGMEAMTETPRAQRCLYLRTATNGERRVEISVTDCGEGIAPEKLHRLFDSFFTTKETGMGLGLAIARSIVDAHQGRISAENNSEGGATFRFDLPTSDEVATSS